MRKKILSLVMALVMVIGLTACGDNGGQEASKETSESLDSASSASEEAAKEVSGTVDEAIKKLIPEGVDPSEYHLAICIHSMDNEFWAQEALGAQLAAKAYGVQSDILTCESDDNKQLQGIKDYIAQYGDKACFVVDPSSTANTVNIAETCEEAGVYVAILFHRADGLYPKDFPHFVTSLALDDITIGKATAKALFESIGGKGQVVELQGLLGDDSAANRHKAFEEALKDYPDIEVVDSQTASWSQSDAMALTENWIVNYPDLKGVFSANDTMALGAIEALKNAGKNGAVKVSGCDGIEAALTAVKNGDLVITNANDGFCIGGYGAAYSLQAALGILDPEKMDPAERLIYSKTTLVTAENADEIYAKFIETKNPGYDYSDLSYCVDKYQEK
uniref:sugar ABC transporter substrate-binding protein n=1 Tax=Ndongobacter massiliensis TaxID=1871025 RepID=UPI0009317693|nr:sugar ABC transporter substrate-binding protein [Ndongobacter massiliensis]